VHNGALLAAPFDLSRLEVTGPPTPVLEGIVSPTNSALERPLYSVSNTGHLAYVPGASTIQRQLVWVDRNGRETPARVELGPYEYPSLSPDGTRVAFTKHDAGHNTWVYDLERGTETRLTRSSSTGNVWAPDGRYLALNIGGIHRQDADGGAAAELIVQDGAAPGAWSPDGTVLIYVRSGDVRDLWAKPLEGAPNAIVESAFDKYQPTLSPDGRFIAYVSTESGIEEVYVQPYPALDRRWLISRDGGREPRWSPRDDELFYRRERQMLAVGFRTQPEFRASAPEVLFEGDYHAGGATNVPDYDIGGDGERFLMIRKEEPYRRINIVLNWFDELERRVPIP
jgi:serine/threonine-protein kinase